MPTLQDFLQLHSRYLSDAEVLYKENRFASAYYLAGYAVECLLKAVICKRIQPNEYPPRNTNNSHYTHFLETLIRTAHLEKDFEFEVEKSKELKQSYLVLKDWIPGELRYDPNQLGKKKAGDFLNAIKAEKGFIKWLTKYL